MWEHGVASWTFTPATNFNGTAEFSYNVSDGATATEQSASMTVNEVNDAPTVGDAVVLGATDEDTSITITSTQLLAGSTDRITSYNVCYTKLLRDNAPTVGDQIVLDGTSEDTSIVITADQLLAGAKDVDGDTLSVTNLTVSPEQGSLEYNEENGTRITSYNVCYTKLLRAMVAVWPTAVVPSLTE